MDEIIKIYLPIFFIGFIILVFIVPSVRVFKQTGINPFRFITNNDNAHDFVGIAMKVFIAILFIVIVTYSISSRVYSYFSPIFYLEKEELKIVGLILGHISLAGIMIAQVHMRQSWRIGIDFENKTPLVTNGLFSVSRNPIYLFLLFALVGVFLLIPNAITFAILFAAFLILHVTMRLEEEFLYKQHGDEYLLYKKKVRRLL